MPGESHITNAVGALTVVGGAMGYAKKRSTASLMAGLLVGGMFLAGGQIIERGHPEVGHPVALGTSVALLCAMGSRFARGRQMWPAGVMTAVALATAAYEAKKTLDWTF